MVSMRNFKKLVFSISIFKFILFSSHEKLVTNAASDQGRKCGFDVKNEFPPALCSANSSNKFLFVSPTKHVWYDLSRRLTRMYTNPCTTTGMSTLTGVIRSSGISIGNPLTGDVAEEAGTCSVLVFHVWSFYSKSFLTPPKFLPCFEK